MKTTNTNSTTWIPIVNTAAVIVVGETDVAPVTDEAAIVVGETDVAPVIDAAVTEGVTNAVVTVADAVIVADLLPETPTDPQVDQEATEIIEGPRRSKLNENLCRPEQ